MKDSLDSYLDRIRRRTQRTIDRCQKLANKGCLIEAVAKVPHGAEMMPNPVRKMLAQEKRDRTTVRIQLDVPVWVYAEFCAAAAVRGLPNWEVAVMDYLRNTVCEWSEVGYYLED